MKSSLDCRSLAWLATGLGLLAAAHADDFDTSRTRAAVDRQLSPYGLEGWHPFQKPATATATATTQLITPEAIRQREDRLRAIILPTFKLQAVPLFEALDQLQRLIQDQQPKTPQQRPFVFFSKIADLRETPVTLDLNRVTAVDALQEIARPLGLRITYGSNGIIFIRQP